MSLSSMLTQRRRTNRNGSNGEMAVAGNGEHDDENKVAFEMNLHVPCRVAGITRNGSRWEGKTTTVSISSFGARLLLPVEAELEGDISLLFKIPVPLRVLFPRKAFRLEAETRPSGAAGPTLPHSGQKVVHVAFSKPLNFRLGTAKSEA